MIRDRHIYKEIPSPEQVNQMTEPPMLKLIYAAIFMCLRLLIDIRRYTVPKEAYLAKKEKETKE